MRLVVCLQALLGVVCCANLASAQGPGWDLVWSDEFDGTSLNTSNWIALNREDSNNDELQFYHPNQVTVSNGNLELTAINVPLGNKLFQSGLITSNNLFGPGRFEARVDLPTTQGMWPAFWLNANHIDWPQGGEIDILENRGSEPNLVSSAYHWESCCGQHELVYHEYTATESGGQPVNFHNDFHTYAAEWDETIIRYYVDGNLHFTVTEDANLPIFETAKNIIVNLAVGGNFGGDPDGSTVFPQTMLVDYVRYWQREVTPPQPGINLLSNPGFDDNGGSLDGWSDFGNTFTIPNVSANNDLANDGTHALKIFGQFNGPGNLSGASQGVAVSGGESLLAVASALTPTGDTLFGKSNEVTMKIEFYSVFGAAFMSSDFISEESLLIHDGSTAESIWFDHSLEAIAPQNAVEARLSFVFEQPGDDNGAIWIDSTGLFLETGDFDLDNDVDGADFLAWQRDNSVGSLATWEANYGTAAPLAASTAVPEPGTLLLLLAGIACLLGPVSGRTQPTC
jgi:beta-glucanase (GH16 family)